MEHSTVFMNHRTQAVRLPVGVRFPEGTKDVYVRKLGKALIITPAAETWDHFFLQGPKMSEDFLNERATQAQTDRESL